MEIPLGMKIVRLVPSSTARNIQAGDIGIVGGLNPSAHAQPTDDFGDGIAFMPVQWKRTKLWSNLQPEDFGFIWRTIPPTVRVGPRLTRINIKILPPIVDEEEDEEDQDMESNVE